MLQRTILFIFFSGLHFLSYGVASRYPSVDSFVLSMSMPVNNLGEYDSLISIFNKQFINQEEKLRAVYFWVTENIAYDGEGLYNGNMISEKTGALKYKRCVCTGYADLLDHAYKKMGLESEYLVGKARLLDGQFQWNPDSWLNGHAWNAVKIDDKWRLIDATWASGYLSGRSFYKKRDDFWFLTSPSLFLLSHYPDKSQFQLIPLRLTVKEFYDQPYCLWEFGKSGITVFRPTKLILRISPQTSQRIAFRSVREINRAYIMNEWGSVMQTARVDEENEVYSFYINGKNAREGKLYIGFGYADEKNRLVWKADFVLSYLLSFTVLPTENTE